MALPATNKRPRNRLVIADIDGTLVTKEKLLTPKSVQAVQQLNEAGVLFGITTGRPWADARMLVDSLPETILLLDLAGCARLTKSG